MKLLERKTAIITGASRGIGRGIAQSFAEQGVLLHLLIVANIEAAESLSKNLIATGVKAKGYQSNAADFESAQELVEDVLKDFGRLDILINNAGITKTTY